MEIKPNLLLTLPGGLWLQLLQGTSHYPKSEMIQCSQKNIKSTILFPYRMIIFSSLKTLGLGDNINRRCHLQALKNVE